jgi:TRAP-type C4-dicarboxylate transport system permease small subunit
MTITKYFQKVEEVIFRVGEWAILVSGLMCVVMAISSTYAVTRRYLFDKPEPYSYEISTMFLLISCLLTFASLQRNKRHLRVDFLANYFPQKLQLFLLDILGPLAGLFFSGIILWQSWSGAIYSLSVNELSSSFWQEPVWPIRFVIPICMFWLMLVLISQLVHGIINIGKKSQSSDKQKPNPANV